MVRRVSMKIVFEINFLLDRVAFGEVNCNKNKNIDQKIDSFLSTRLPFKPIICYGYCPINLLAYVKRAGC